MPGGNGSRRARPSAVRVHDFPGDAVGKAIPYGVYDMARNEAWVSVGPRPRHAGLRRRVDPPVVDDDGAAAPIPTADALCITADAGGSNGYRSRGVEGRAATAGRRPAPAHPRLPLPAGHEQVEQDRAPALLPHHAELARPSAAHLRDHRRADRPHPHRDRACASRPSWTSDATRPASSSPRRRCATSPCIRTPFTATGTMNCGPDQVDYSISIRGLRADLEDYRLKTTA